MGLVPYLRLLHLFGEGLKALDKLRTRSRASRFVVAVVRERHRSSELVLELASRVVPAERGLVHQPGKTLIVGETVTAEPLPELAAETVQLVSMPDYGVRSFEQLRWQIR
jgi:hypothetical protein